MRAMLKGLRDRGNLPQNPLSHLHSPLPIQPPPMAAPPSIRNTSVIKQATKIAPQEQPLSEPVQNVKEVEESVGRDPGVTAVVWTQLQADKAAAIKEQKQREEAVEKTRKELHDAEEAEERAQREVVKVLEEARLADKSRQEEIMKKME